MKTALDLDYYDCLADEQSQSNHIDSHIAHSRVIVHIDLDCFYATVEAIRNPALRGLPIGIRQKNIVVTSNYEARALGVKKMMYVDEAKKILPSLILINGEDLAHYRVFSERVHTILETYSGLVEKLGLDENYVDVTDSVAADSTPVTTSDIQGHVFDYTSAIHESCRCGCVSRLTKGSIIANKIRDKLQYEIGISSSAGIAHVKTQ